MEEDEAIQHIQGIHTPVQKLGVISTGDGRIFESLFDFNAHMLLQNVEESSRSKRRKVVQPQKFLPAIAEEEHRRASKEREEIRKKRKQALIDQIQATDGTPEWLTKSTEQESSNEPVSIGDWDGESPPPLKDCTVPIVLDIKDRHVAGIKKVSVQVKLNCKCSLKRTKSLPVSGKKGEKVNKNKCIRCLQHFCQKCFFVNTAELRRGWECPMCTELVAIHEPTNRFSILQASYDNFYVHEDRDNILRLSPMSNPPVATRHWRFGEHWKSFNPSKA